MKYLLAICAAICCGISIYSAILQTVCILRCLMFISAALSLFVAIYGLYANIKLDKRLDYLEKNACKKPYFENETMHFLGIKEQSKE